MSSVEQRLKNLNITLPSPAAPAANYVPFVRSGNLLFVSGQLPMGVDGLVYKGKVGGDVAVEDGKAAARLCAINLLAQAKAALGDLELVSRCVKIGGFVNCPADFYDHPAIINGASDLIVEVLGDAGRHARVAMGANALPFNAAVEVEAVFEIKT
jgi:enamine deaminase RidA (YjgF/YER057c/UK114 family)